MNNTAFVHTGIKGQKWGQRRYQNPDGTYTELEKERRRVSNKRTNKQALESALNKLGNKTKVRVSNSFDDWGNSKETNLLRITGLSGSGKSTFAKALGKEADAEVINLDEFNFYEKPENSKNPDFARFLEKKVPEWKRFGLDEDEEETEFDADEWNETRKKILETLDEYAQSKYGEKKVIAEGVHFLPDKFAIIDEEKSKKSLSDSPSVIVQSSLLKSNFQAALRSYKLGDNFLEVAEEFMLRFSRQSSPQIDWNDSIKRATKWLDEQS